jgi:hypothetical protein
MPGGFLTCMYLRCLQALCHPRPLAGQVAQAIFRRRPLRAPCGRHLATAPPACAETDEPKVQIERPNRGIPADRVLGVW